MDSEELKELVREIVKEAEELKDKHTDQKRARVNYACIFSQNKTEFEGLKGLAGKIGKIIEETPTGPLFQIKLKTAAGELRLLKIRMPDRTRPERGDADFTVLNYSEFKEKFLSRKGFRLIKKREDFEMIELMDIGFKVRVYFSNPPLDRQLGI